MSTIVSAVLIGFVTRKIGTLRTAFVGFVFGIAGFAIYGVAPTTVIFLAAFPLIGLWGLCGPSLQALMSARADASEQGRVQGALGSIFRRRGNDRTPAVHANLRDRNCPHAGCPISRSTLYACSDSARRKSGDIVAGNAFARRIILTASFGRGSWGRHSCLRRAFKRVSRLKERLR